jgi:hypothetical protein
MLVIHRQESTSETGNGVALGPPARKSLFAVGLEKNRVEQIDQREVESVQPDHWLVGFIAMVVPGPRGRDHEIARPYRGPLAVYRGVGAIAFDNEAQRALGVAMASVVSRNYVA